MKYEKLIPKSAFKFYSYLKKDLMLLYKRKNYLSIFILLPLIIAGLFLLALQPSNYSIDIGICNSDMGDLSDAVFEIDNFNPIILAKENCKENLITGINTGEFPLGIIINPGFSKNIENLKQSKIDVYYDNTDVSFAGLISWKLENSLKPLKIQIIEELNKELGSKTKTTHEGISLIGKEIGLDFKEGKLKDLDISLRNIEELDTEFLMDPIYVSHNPLYSGEVGKSAGIIFIMPVLILFLLLMLASTSIIYDKKANFIMRVKSSTTILNYIAAKLVFLILLVFVQFSIILLLFLAFRNQYQFNILGILELIVSIAIVDGLLGFLIGIVSENEGLAVLFSLVISFPLMLISGIFFPTQTLPKLIQWIAGSMPLEFQIQSRKNVLLLGNAMSHNWLWLTLILFILVIYIMRKKI